MREPAKPVRPIAYHASASAVAAVSAGPNFPRSKSTRTIGARRTTRPAMAGIAMYAARRSEKFRVSATARVSRAAACRAITGRSEEHTSELQSRGHLVCRLLLEKKNQPPTTDDPQTTHTTC